MALTRPTIQNINTNLTTFTDSLTVTNFGNVANRDIGQVFDRSSDGGSNVAVFWQESTKSFSFAYTSSTGKDAGNLTVTGNASLIVGNVTANNIVTSNGVLFRDADASNYVGFKAASGVASNLIWTLPSGDGTSGQVLSTDGGGILSWTTGGGGGGGTGGYNNSTLTAFPGSAGNVFYGNGETYVGESVTTDAFGISIIATFYCGDPLGSLQAVDLGTVP